MYKKNPLGIYVYPDDIRTINNIHWEVNSINREYLFNQICYSRFINSNLYGFYLERHIDNKYI